MATLCLCLLVFDEGMDRLDRTEKQSRTLLKTKPEPETVLFRVRLIGCIPSLIESEEATANSFKLMAKKLTK